jgi:2-polyprenyl-6-methoxyphenol hydroxylase-like FAD-dependent oxidoreductase
MTETSALIAGGGPVGPVLALELEHRGVDAILVERNPTTTRHPKMDVTNGRSMEHFRRLGIADEIRSHGVRRTIR